MTASPMNLSIVPPYRVIASARRPRTVADSSRTSSGSRRSESVVNPTMSANRTVTTRRSSTSSSSASTSGSDRISAAAPQLASGLADVPDVTAGAGGNTVEAEPGLAEGAGVGDEAASEDRGDEDATGRAVGGG